MTYTPCQTLIPDKPRRNRGFKLYPYYAAYSHKEAIARLGCSAPILNDYRRFALKHIPEYYEVSDAIWLENVGSTYIAARMEAIAKGRTPPVVDRPPFYEPQLYILEAVQTLIRRYGDRDIVAKKLKQYPQIWRTK